MARSLRPIRGMIGITEDMLARYDVPVPRYTSYPPALAFEPLDAPPELEGDERNRPLSLYFHMMFCRQLCWYCACNKKVERRQARSGAYLDRLLSELEMRAPWVEHRSIVQMHLGGGTPTFFTATELDALTRFVRQRFDVDSGAELSIEIDPRELDDEHVDVLAASGYNRASLGVQDHDPRVQAAINREQPRQMTADAVRRLRNVGIDQINVDLVYGLPHQTVDSFRRTVEEVIDLRPDRLAIYAYAHVPWVAPAQKLLTRDTALPDRAVKLGMFAAAVDVLVAAGYEHIGMDHFARMDDPLAIARREGTMRRNFMGYTTHRGVDIQAFGASAISQTATTYFQNVRDLEPWEQAIDAGEHPVARGLRLREEDQLRREIIMGVMCSHVVDFATIGEPWGVDARPILRSAESALAPFIADNLVEVRGDCVSVTETGRFLVRNIAAAFDVDRSAEGYSRAV